MSFGKMMLHLFLICIVTYLFALSFLYIFQRNLLYFPSRHYTPPAEAGANPNLKEFPVTTTDGLALKGWYASAAQGKPTIIFFHGNAHDLKSAASIADPYIEAGYGFLLTEYRGYSGLPGSPSEDGLYTDARAYIRALEASGVKENDIVLYGHSLGTGVAVQMATEFNIGKLVLLAPYLSVIKVAKIRFPIFPVESLVKDRFESFRKIMNVKMPILISHGERDMVIPFSQGKELYELANQPKTLHAFPDGGHNDIFDDLVPVLKNWLNPPIH